MKNPFKDITFFIPRLPLHKLVPAHARDRTNVLKENMFVLFEDISCTCSGHIFYLKNYHIEIIYFFRWYGTSEPGVFLFHVSAACGGAWKKIFSVIVSFANMSWMRQHLFVYAKNSVDAS